MKSTQESLERGSCVLLEVENVSGYAFEEKPHQLHSALRGPASSLRKNSFPGSVGMKLEVTHIEGP